MKLCFWKREADAQPAGIAEIVRHFNAAAADEEHFPSAIDPRIFHVQLILREFGDLNGKRVLDVGAGKGRFARVLLQQHASARLVAFDLAEEMLHFVPPGIGRSAGSMTSLPFASGIFDCAYATESLEHAVDIEAAVQEMCRVVRPGGRLVIIDKNAAQWGRLKTSTWEKWFDRKDLEKLLRRYCQQVKSQPISYWEDVAPDGLFIAWIATK